ncbi:MAG: helix-turn-helix domain-containing protein [Kordiimonas sp.]
MTLLDIDSYVMAALSFHTIFMAAYLLTAKDERSDYLKLLGCTFIMLTGWYVSNFFEGAGIFREHPWLIDWPTLFIPLFAPSLYFYVQAVSSQKSWDWHSQPRIHYYFAAAIVLIELPFALAPGNVKILQLEHFAAEPEGWAKILVTLGWVSTALLLVQFACYIVLSIRRLLSHAVRIRHLFSNIENRSLLWLRNYLLLLCLLWALGFSDFVDLPNDYSWIFHILWVMTFSLLSLRQKPVFAIEEQAPTLAELSPVANGNKQSRTTLSAERRERIARKLQKVMDEDLLYKDADLTLRKLSDIAGVSTHHISETLREEMQKNFYDFVNSCRIADACKLLTTTTDATMDIAFTVGFNSRSTFNAAFKKHTDTSPAAYRKNSLKLS